MLDYCSISRYGCQNVPATFSSLGNLSEELTQSSSRLEDVDDIVFDAGEWNRPDWKLFIDDFE